MVEKTTRSSPSRYFKLDNIAFVIIKKGVLICRHDVTPQKLDFFSVAVYMATPLFLCSQESKPVLHWT